MFESLTLPRVMEPGRVQAWFLRLLSIRCSPFFWATNTQKRSHCLLVSKVVNDILRHYSENQKFGEQAFESLTFAQIGVAARSPVCHIFNVSSFFWALSTKNRGRSVDSRAYILFCL